MRERAAPGGETDDWGRAARGAAFALLALLALVLYANALAAPFYLDDGYITRDASMTGSLGKLLREAPGPLRRRLPLVTFWIDRQLAGTPRGPLADGTFGSTVVFHVENVAIHVVNAVLLWELAALLLAGVLPRRRARAVGLAAALLFLVHPASTAAVTYIAQRYALLAATWTLGALLAYARLRALLESGAAAGPGGSRRATRLAATVLACLVLGGLTKENTLAIPLLLVATELAFFSGRGLDADGNLPAWLRRVPAKARRAFLCGHAFPLAALAIVVRAFQVPVAEWLGPPSAPPDFPDRASYLRTQLVVVLAYLRLWFAPTGFALDAGFPRLDWGENGGRLLLALVAHALLVTLGVLLWRRGRRELAFAVAAFYLALSVESSILPLADAMADHRLYLPQAFLALGLAAALARTHASLGARPAARVLAAGALVWVLLLATATVARNRDWGDPLVLWGKNIVARPGAGRAHANLGHELQRRGLTLASIEPFETSLALGVVHPATLDGLGEAYLALGEALPDHGPRTVRPSRLLLASQEACRLGLAIEAAVGGKADLSVPELATPRLLATLGKVDLELAPQCPDRRIAQELAHEATECSRRAAEGSPGNATLWLQAGYAAAYEATGAGREAKVALARDALAALDRAGTLPAGPLARLQALSRARALVALERHPEAFLVLDDLTRERVADDVFFLWEEEAAVTADAAAREAQGTQEARPRLVGAVPRLEAVGRSVAQRGDGRVAARYLRTAGKIALQVQGDPARAAADFREASRGLPPGPERGDLERWADSLPR